MFVAKVLVGSFTEGKSDMRKPPSKSSADSSNLFDSCVNDVSNPKIFVVFDIDQYYPSHLIEFIAKKTAQAPTARNSTSAASYLSGYTSPSHNTQIKSRVSGSTQGKVGQNKLSNWSRSNTSSNTSLASNRSISGSHSTSNSNSAARNVTLGGMSNKSNTYSSQSTLGSPGVSGYNQNTGGQSNLSQGVFSYPSSSSSTGYGRSTTSNTTTRSRQSTFSDPYSAYQYISADDFDTSYPRTSSTNKSSKSTKGCSVM